METTLDKRSIITPNKLLTDNYTESKDFSNVMQSIDYKLSLNENKDLNNEITNKPSLDNLFNDKIHALYSKAEVVNKLYFKQTQNWVGHIIEIHDEYFTARLDEINQLSTFEVAEFDFAEVSVADQKLIALGSIFYWSVGYAVRGSQIFKESFIRFQRLPTWNVDEFDSVIDQASNLRSRLKWE